MLKKSMLLGLVLAAPAAFSSSFMNLIGVAAPKGEVKHALVKHPTVSQKYTDFTGTWMGTCQISGRETQEETLVIENSAEDITVNGLYLTIAAFSTHSIINDRYAFDSHYRMNWSEDGSELNINGVSILRSAENTEDSTEVHSYRDVMSLVDGNLQIRGKVRSLSGNDAWTIDCEMKSAS